MPAVHFRSVSFWYTTAVPILRDLSTSLGADWTGVVGSNGAGKTTILRLVEGTLDPAGGELERDPVDAVIVHCPQTAEVVDRSIEHLAGAGDGAARALLGRLELDRVDLERWPTLSPGERKRWQIGGALYQRPDILLVDEPTNHLDAAARSLLLDALDRFDGVGLIVSHDRTVLNRLCRRILRIDSSSVVLWQGDYDTARRSWEAAAERDLDGYRQVRAEQKRVERRLEDKRRASATKTARHKRELRRAGIKDKDARSMEKKGRFAGGQQQGSREIRLLRDEAERLGGVAAGLDITRPLGGELFFDYRPARRRNLLRYHGPLEAGGFTVAGDVEVVVSREDRVRLIGPNGAGKSTLLRALLDTATIDVDRILHLPQELTREDARALVAAVDALDPATKGRTMGIVAVLGSDPKRILATDLPSPGEARKLLIATGLGRGAWVLLLDEPTNHLDLPSIERLEAALHAYPGAVVVVTHDADFARQTTTSEWRLDGGVLTCAG